MSTFWGGNDRYRDCRAIQHCGEEWYSRDRICRRIEGPGHEDKRSRHRSRENKDCSGIAHCACCHPRIDTTCRGLQYQLRYPVYRFESTYFLWWWQRCILEALVAHHHLGIVVCLLHDLADRTSHVPHCGAIEKTNEQILQRKVDLNPWIARTRILPFDRYCLSGKKDPGQTGMEW